MMRTEEIPVQEPGTDVELDARSQNAEAPLEVSVVDTKSETETKEADPFAKGHERLAKFSNFISSSKEKASGLFSRVGKGFSKMMSWGKGKSVETAAAILSADEIAKKSATAAREWTNDKIKSAAEWKDEKIYDTAEFFSDAADSAYEWGADKASKAAEFTRTKADQIKNFGKTKVDLAESIAFFAANKTVDGLTKAKNGITERYLQLKKFGYDAIENAKQRKAERIKNRQVKEQLVKLERMKKELAKMNAAREAAKLEEKKKEDLEWNIALVEEEMEINGMLSAA